MKTFDFDLDRFQTEQVFSAIRTKEDVIKLWMRAVKIVSAYVKPEAGTAVSQMRLHVDKMSRLFFIDADKVFSVNFPFFTQESDGWFYFSCSSCSSVDSRVTSEVLSLISTHNVLALDDLYLFLDPIAAAVEIDSSVWSLFKYLMTCDDGYLRFDHDVARENGDLHPKNHIDIFYSTATTFKIGLSDRMSVIEFADLLDVGTDCHFLHRK
ncbi:hypothetical protein [Rhizobium mayense]|uniref:Uncharacterized protein n=1 Tax=Rhizobium mayense TaxID=1312184 RepID=A0ABT7JTP8_9HYPH|nr:hypothetical protein [Rhizobium mayense]MDL2399712.1 hypothetical protein [Rhizobium mayense]